MSTGLEPRLQALMGTDELERLRTEAEAELREPGRWGTTLTLIQSWGHTSP